jgi:hypothetical protein
MQSAQYITRHTFDVKKVMEIWLKRDYKTVLNVRRNYLNSTMRITYTKSIDDISNNDMTEDKILVTYMTQSFFYFKYIINFHWLNFPNESYIVENISSNDWVLVNIKQLGK